jgi:translation initiation factor 4A
MKSTNVFTGVETDMDFRTSAQIEKETETETETEKEKEKEKEIKTWDDMQLRDELLRGVYAYGFEAPSPIQLKAIGPFLAGRDLIGQAQSGTGKTGAFSIGVLQRIDLSMGTQVLLLAPTHELVMQIHDVISKLGAFMPGLQLKTAVGGTAVSDDVAHIKKYVPHIIVGTPGRVCDLLHRHAIKYGDITMVVMDEADELLNTGFRENVHSIFTFLNPSAQVALFTATLPEDIVALSKSLMRDPFHITMKPAELNIEGIQHFYIKIDNDYDKFSRIKELFATCVVSQCIIYVNNINKVIELYRDLISEDYPVSCIHSAMSKTERAQEFLAFQRGTSRLLISSNITARGIDIQHVGMVINYDIPFDVHTYLHRVGRGGRYGRKGIAINLLSKYDVVALTNIEKHYDLVMKPYA